MSGPVGWIVLSRETPGTPQISVVGILDPKVVPDASSALVFLKEKLPYVNQAFRLAVFGLMHHRLEHISKRNLHRALDELGLNPANVDEVYVDIAAYIRRMGKIAHSH